ncbi:MAG: aldehyde dehydrogenase family protein [Chloroflexota bacterium]|nr:aldehyde dehydrogenase family protein [Chloroflexota bacterium]
MAQAEQTLPKVTYAAIPTDQLDALHSAYEEALGRVRGQLGGSYPMYIAGREVRSESGEFEVSAPSNRDLLLGRFQKGTPEHARQAIDAAAEAFRTWGRMPHAERLVLLRAAADNFRAQKLDLSALLSIEAGKTRMEALGEVEEAADLISTYCDYMEENNGYIRQMDSLMPGERNVSVLKPLGVWAVVAPFNFPVALATGMLAGALVAGNTVVFKPASATPYSGLLVYRMFAEAGLPDGVLNFITGGGGAIGDELATNPKVAGMVFTGSREVGSDVYKKFAEPYARPCITEMGGKNPAIVTAKADLDKAAEGVMRSAFGYTGQKCSACSRVYVERPVYDQFLQMLVERAKGVKVGEPTEKDTFMGPVINEKSVETYLTAADEARRDGEVFFGGNRLTEEHYANGTYVEPAIVGNLPVEHRLFREELFVPFVAVAPVDSLDEALRLANDSEYGLTAGVYSEDPSEVQQFFDNIEAGVTYANRRGGATTGAWPGAQSFCGWKGSGSTGKGGLGPYYVAQFLREQSQTVITEESKPDAERLEVEAAGE